MRVYPGLWLERWSSGRVGLAGLAWLVWGGWVILRTRGPGGWVILGTWGLVAVTIFGLAVGCYPVMEKPLTGEIGRFWLYASSLLATAAVALGALCAVSPVGAAFVLVLGAATSPWCVAWVRKAARSENGPASVPDLSLEGPTSAGAPVPRGSWLTDAELCQAWRASFGALLQASDPDERERVVELRQTYLDELLRRYPEPVRTWLATGPRAAGGPEEYLRA